MFSINHIVQVGSRRIPETLIERLLCQLGAIVQFACFLIASGRMGASRIFGW
jgi:hypothetical protein